MKQIWLANGLTGELGGQLKRILDKSDAVDLRALDLNAPTSATRLLHVAARRPVHSLSEQIRSNLLYLHRVLRYAEANEINEFVFFSTASLYSRSSAKKVGEEDVKFPWSDGYSWTKWLGEKMVARARIPCRVILRLPGVLEVKGATNFISRAYVELKQGRPLQCSHLDRPFNRFISADEIVDFLSKSKSITQPGLHLVNLAPEPTHNLRELLTVLADSLGKTPNLSESPKTTSAHSILDNSALISKYGWSPAPADKMIRGWVARRQTLN